MPELAAEPPFSWKVRVYWEDTDAGGVVYHAGYLRFMERARSEWMRALGVDQMAYKQATGLAFMVRDMHIDFLRPALLDDELSVTVEVKERRCQYPVRPDDHEGGRQVPGSRQRARGVRGAGTHAAGGDT